MFAAIAVAAVLLAAWAIGRSGLLDRISRGLGAAGRPRWMADAACGGAVAGLIAFALTPLEAIAAGSAGYAVALVLAFRQAAVIALMGALGAVLVYGLIRTLPRFWALSLGGLSAAAVFGAVWLPFAQSWGLAPLTPAPAGPARSGLESLIAQTHLPASGVYLTPTHAIDADVTGVGAAKVTVSRGLWEAASPQELRASIGHLVGHWAHHDQLWIALMLTAVALGLFVVPRALYPAAARLLKLPTDISDPSGLPVLVVVATLWLCIGVSLDHALIRWVNVRADQYSLDHAREPDGLALTLLREWRGEDPHPWPLQEALFYDHPSLHGRMVHAMSWKASHPG
jgi:STE24 endopeptidase